jgi:hypothetical protein
LPSYQGCNIGSTQIAIVCHNYLILNIPLLSVAQQDHR